MTQTTTTGAPPSDTGGSGTFGFNFTPVSGEDIKSGLPVIIYARWVLVITGLALTLWNSGSFIEAQVSVAIILGLAVGNFFLQVEVNRERPIPTWIVYAASAVDIAAITSVLALTNTFPSSTYVFYMPALLALSVTFSTFNTAKYTVGALAAYTLVSIAPINDIGGGTVETTSLLVHVLVLLSVPFCGNVYWRLERTRRAEEINNDLVEQQLTDNYVTTSVGGDA
ncbi:MAG: hypothetical protein QF357_03945 [Dehalococcoidia bacterium]|jgi:hypothetical protein|nr:hypothetical protein [Dehalococcoidia bacterium]